MNKRNLAILFLGLLGATKSQAQNQTYWKASLERADGESIPFTLSSTANFTHIKIHNGKDIMSLTNQKIVGDSLYIDMPVFESGFILHKESINTYKGFWVRHGAAAYQQFPITIQKSLPRFATKKVAKPLNMNGKFAIAFGHSHNPEDSAIGNFVQKGNRITGSILTPTGDYRFMEGVASKDSFFISTFDGVHSIVFKGTKNKSQITGNIISGPKSKESFTGELQANPVLPETAKMFLKDPLNNKPQFSFKDLDGNIVSLSDERFKDKVVVLDIMGSWCPNCLDESSFLSSYYQKNKHKGIEVIGLCYEYTTDFDRSKKSIEKFQKNLHITYPLLITGVAVSDPQRTEKTLPLLSPIKMFPTTIVLNKKGEVVDIDTGFQGPGTGEYYDKFVQKFDNLIDKLTKE